MKFPIRLVIILINITLGFAGLTKTTPADRVGRIVGGKEAKPHSYPYVVSLQLRFLWVRAHICGGTLLNKNWVLTAAHCVKESFIIRWLPMDAVIGAHDVDYFGPSAQVIPIQKRVPHPRFTGGIGPYDIAMLRLQTPATFTNRIQPITLPSEYDLEGKSMNLAGWGALKTTFFFPDLPSKLQEVTVKYMDYDECFQALERVKDDGEINPLDREANICTGPITGGIAACNGDSGGPLVQYVYRNDYANDPVEEITEENWENELYNENTENYENVKDVDANVIDSKKIKQESEKSNKICIKITNNNNGNINVSVKVKDDDDNKIPVIFGVVSWGISPCGEKGAPTVYTKVSTYLDFINEYINK